jgi:phosphoribosylaminoimidazole carboxylase PurE protein
MNTERVPVIIAFGSISDWQSTMKFAADTLDELGVPYRVRILSAHRTPEVLMEFAKRAEMEGFKVVIAGAGGAAHLPGMFAAETILPVFGVPVQSQALNGVDSLYSIVQMPAGVPVGTLAIGKPGAIDAALLAASVLALNDEGIRKRLRAYRAKLTRNVLKYVPGELLIEGKTKKVLRIVGEKGIVILESKDDITAGDGKKHDVIPGKAKMSTETTGNVFKFLERHGVPVAYVEPATDTAFIARNTKMLPYEVVIRGEGDGSYLERYPNAKKGERFRAPRVEFFLKTNGKNWKGKKLVCDDPLMTFGKKEGISLFDPHKVRKNSKPFLRLTASEVFTTDREHELFPQMEKIAIKVFQLLSEAWEGQGGRLIDMKIEFGIDDNGYLLVSDVIDNDSWRVWYNGGYIDKQKYRDGEDLAKVADAYAIVAGKSRDFALRSRGGL